MFFKINLMLFKNNLYCIFYYLRFVLIQFSFSVQIFLKKKNISVQLGSRILRRIATQTCIMQ